MKSYACFVRGINVSGKNIIGMDRLSDIFTRAGFAYVKTYLQSGNVVFATPYDSAVSGLEEIIRSSLKKEMKTDIPVMVKSSDQLEQVLIESPFAGKAEYSEDLLHITLLGTVPGREKAEEFNLKKYEPEEFVLKESVVYLFCPDGYGRAKLNNNFIEKKLGVEATTRNWRSFRNILELVRNLK